MNVRCLLGRHQWADVDRYESERSCRQGKTCLRCGTFTSLPGEKHVWETWRYAAADACHGWQICVRCGRQDDARHEPRHQWDTVEYHTPEAGEVVQICQRCGAREVHAIWTMLEASPPADAMAQYASLVEHVPEDRPDWHEALGAHLVMVLKGDHSFRKTRETGLSLSPSEWASINRENFRLAERARVTAADLLGVMGYENAWVELLALYLYNLCSPYEVTYEDPELFSQAMRNTLAKFGVALSPDVEDAAQQIRLGSLQEAVTLTRDLATNPNSQVVALLLMIARDQFRMSQESFDEEGPLRSTAISVLEEVLHNHPSVFTDEQLRDIESFPLSLRIDFPLGGVDGLLHEDYELDFSKIVAAAGAELQSRSGIRGTS
jgi:hypothetical protein